MKMNEDRAIERTKKMIEINKKGKYNDTYVKYDLRISQDSPET